MSPNGTPELQYPESTPTPSAPRWKQEPIDDDAFLLHGKSPSYHPRSPTPDDLPGSNPTIYSCPTPPTSLARTPTPPTMTGRLPSPITEQINNSPENGPGVYPGALWMRWHDLPGIPTFAVNDNGQMKALPYVSFREILGHTLQVGTEGLGCQPYSREVLLGPSDPIPGSTVDDRDLDYFIKDPTFNFVVNQAIESLDDPGLTAEVARLRAMHLQLPIVVERAKLVEHLMRSFQAFHEAHHSHNESFMKRLDECKNRLIAGRARSRVERAAIDLARQGKVGGRFYWPGLPGFPEHPGHFPQVRREGLVKARTGHWSEKKQEKWVEDWGLNKRRNQHQCKWCGKKGHFNKDCRAPHTGCRAHCKVPGTHRNFQNEKCARSHNKTGKPGRPKQEVQQWNNFFATPCNQMDLD